MSREQAIDLLDNLIGMIDDNQENDYDEALKRGIKAIQKLEQIDQIINAPVYIHEDVLRYKMICEVIK